MILNFTYILLLIYCFVVVFYINYTLEYSLFFWVKNYNSSSDSTFIILKTSSNDNNFNSSNSSNKSNIEDEKVLEYFVEKVGFLNKNTNLPQNERISLLSDLADEVFQLHQEGYDVNRIGLSRLLNSRQDFIMIKRELIANDSTVLEDHRGESNTDEVIITPPNSGGNNGTPWIIGWKPEPGNNNTNNSNSNTSLFEKILFSLLSLVTYIIDFILEFLDQFNDFL